MKVQIEQEASVLKAMFHELETPAQVTVVEVPRLPMPLVPGQDCWMPSLPSALAHEGLVACHLVSQC